MTAFWNIIIVAFVMSLPISYGAEFSLYQKNQVAVEGGQAFPIAHTAQHYEKGAMSWTVGYRHMLDEEWMMEIDVLSKSLINKADRSPLTFFGASHTAYRLFRLYYNTYVLVGPRFSYLYPMKAFGFPPKRELNVEPEIGAALSLALHFFVTEDWLVSLRFDRWRGTSSNRFHGIETSYGLGYQIH
jgi:hypothetical protein